MTETTFDINGIGHLYNNVGTGIYSYSDAWVGRQSSTQLRRTFISFDTSDIPRAATITDVKLKLTGNDDQSLQEFTIRVKTWTGGPTLTTDDWTAWDSTTLGTIESTSYSTDTDGMVIDLDNDSINLDGQYTSFMLISNRDEDSEAWATDEYIKFEYSGAKAPHLVVTYTYSGSSVEVNYDLVENLMSVKSNDILFEIPYAEANFTNFAGSATDDISLGDMARVYYEGNLKFEGTVASPMMYGNPNVYSVQMVGYGNRLKELYVTPFDYYMETGRTMTVANILSGFPYQHGDGTMEDEPPYAGWSESDAAMVSRSSTKSHTDTYSWQVLTTGAEQYALKKIYVNPDLYDKIKISVWCSCDTASIASLDVKSSSDGSYTSEDHTGGGTWERLECEVDLNSGDNYFVIKLVASGGIEKAYFDDFTWCVHYIGDDSSVWDNGILSRTELSDTNVSCAVEIESFETRESESKFSAINRLLGIADPNIYEWHTSPTAKDFYFTPWSTSSNAIEIIEGSNLMDFNVSDDISDVINDVYVYSSTSSKDWTNLYEHNASIVAIHIVDESTILISDYVYGRKGKIYKSTDYGETFASVYEASNNDEYVWRFSFDEENDTIYAGMRGCGNMLKSTDDGATWSNDATTFKTASRVVKLSDADGTEYLFVGASDTADSDHGKIWRKELPSGSWTEVYDTAAVRQIMAVTGYGNTLLMGISGTSVPSDSTIERCSDPFASAPISFTTVYTGCDWSGGARYDGQILDADEKLNLKTGNHDFYFLSVDDVAGADVGYVLRSLDDGNTWSIVKTFNYFGYELCATDGTIYVSEYSNVGGAIYGDIWVSADEGDSWTTSLDGDANNIFYALASYGNNIYASIYDSGNMDCFLYARADAYNISSHAYDSTSQTNYGVRTRIYNTSEISKKSILDSFANSIITKFKDSQKRLNATICNLETTLDVSKLTNFTKGVEFPMFFPFDFGSSIGLLNGEYPTYEVEYSYPDYTTQLILSNPRENDISAFESLIKTYVSKVVSVSDGIVTEVDSDSKTATVYSTAYNTRISRLTYTDSSIAVGDQVVLAYTNPTEGNPTIIGVIQK